MDGVSSLPDEVLGNILSNLTTKEAALTSVLSKRWRNLLAFVPNLVINDSVFLHPEKDKQDRPEIIQSFMAFVDRVLTLQDNSTIKKFSLKCLSLTKVDSNHVNGWISNVLARGVPNLDLLIIFNTDDDMDDEDNYRLSPNSFESRTLVSLKIGCGIDIGWVAGSVSLPMLKTLVIDTAGVDNFDILLHALPALEELVLVSVLWKDWDVKISNASLKTLTLNDNVCLRTLSIDTPSLIYFKYIGYILSDYPLVNMKNLVDAQIIFLLPPEHLLLVRDPDGAHSFFFQDVVLRFANVWKLFHGIRHVLYLYLSADTLEVLSLCCESMPVFNNLKSLSIKSHKDRGWQAMPVLLRNCPHLENLVIEYQLSRPTIPSIPMELFGEFMPKGSSDREKGIGLFISQKINPKKIIYPTGIKKDRANQVGDHDAHPEDENQGATSDTAQYTRAKDIIFHIHQPIIYLKDFDRVKTHEDRAQYEDDRESLLGDKNRRETLSKSISTRAFSTRTSFHQENTYNEPFDRGKTSHDRVGLGVGTHDPNLSILDRFKLIKPLDQVWIDSLLFYLNPLKTTCCFEAAKLMPLASTQQGLEKKELFLILGKLSFLLFGKLFLLPLRTPFDPGPPSPPENPRRPNLQKESLNHATNIKEHPP